ncbi:hypothetical protein AN640_02750 [Candidatus Epulonipiscium fishelsonii]|uniref:Uncharacterized protein n=1 Tax=Candidatus Epulonipiscium fishelsonii TaxID=77094 RepID=A0ACC8X8A7_9FIRM|nr:hypothetical protein AN640_02750 [Epulopiscium sp. SCG-D08WGA-EpuloA1]
MEAEEETVRIRAMGTTSLGKLVELSKGLISLTIPSKLPEALSIPTATRRAIRVGKILTAIFKPLQLLPQ